MLRTQRQSVASARSLVRIRRRPAPPERCADGALPDPKCRMRTRGVEQGFVLEVMRREGLYPWCKTAQLALIAGCRPYWRRHSRLLAADAWRRGGEALEGIFTVYGCGAASHRRTRRPHRQVHRGGAL